MNEYYVCQKIHKKCKCVPSSKAACIRTWYLPHIRHTFPAARSRRFSQTRQKKKLKEEAVYLIIHTWLMASRSPMEGVYLHVPSPAQLHSHFCSHTCLLMYSGPGGDNGFNPLIISSDGEDGDGGVLIGAQYPAASYEAAHDPQSHVPSCPKEFVPLFSTTQRSVNHNFLHATVCRNLKKETEENSGYCCTARPYYFFAFHLPCINIAISRKSN